MAITATVASIEGGMARLALPGGVDQSDILKVGLSLYRWTQAGAWRGEVQRGRQR